MKTIHLSTSNHISPKKIERESASSLNIFPDGETTQEAFFELIKATDLATSSSKSRLERNGHHKSSTNNFSHSTQQLKKCNLTLRRSQQHADNHNLSDDVMSDNEDLDGDLKQQNGFEMSVDGCTKSDLFLQTLRCNIEEERLILMPEEAIFLSFGVGCLTIHGPSGGSVGYRKVWRRLVEKNPEFPISYAAYHYFRSKNWVPKLGDSYGASYLLYKIGPSAYHASYLVHILGFPSRPSPTWNQLNAWVRLGCHASKNVLLCEVSVPIRFDAVTSEPRSIFDMSLHETCLFRWKANSGTLIKF